MKVFNNFYNSCAYYGISWGCISFGSRFSSFAYLKNLPVDYLKIYGGFVKDMVHNVVDHTMVESINQIAHTMEIRTIAEFVEDNETLKLLRKMGVNYAQGYGIDKPAPYPGSENGRSQTEAGAARLNGAGNLHCCIT